MEQNIGLVTLVVKEYNEAIEFYTQKVGFDLVEDSQLSEEKRWVVIKPKNSNSTGLLLAQAANENQMKSVGNQTGGRVFLFLNTDDFWRDYKDMIEKGVGFLEEPREETYGIVAVFEDLYGNKWDLLELKK